MTEKVLTGKIARSRIGTLTLPPLPAGLIDAFRKIDEPTCAVADALDELGIIGAIGSTTLKPTIQGSSIVGRALTLRNVVIGRDAISAARDKDNRMAEVEAHNLAEKDDVIVVQGVHGNSNLGGNGMQLGKRQGEVGAIIDGGVRDIGHTRAIGFPVWAKEFTPITGKWRVETVEINGPVVICGVVVHPGDLVIADQSGVCFVPHARAEEVLAFAIKKSQAEEASAKRIDEGISVLDYAGAGKKK